MSDYSIVSIVLIALILISNFFYWSRVRKWYAIRKAFPLTEDKPASEAIHLEYGDSNICGHYAKNRLFSGITKHGFVIRKGFPSSLFMPPVLIPWEAVKQVSLVTNLEGVYASEMIKDLASSDYAKLELKEYPDFLIVIPWQPLYADHLPKDLPLIG